MAKVSTYLPTELRDAAIDADLNLSGLLREAVQRALGERDQCAHPVLVCSKCGSTVHPDE